MDDLATEIGERLKEERIRLGMTQKEMASLGGQAVNSQSLYERGKSAPGGIYLAAIAAVGVDVLYVITGYRGGSRSGVPQRDAETLLDKLERSAGERPELSQADGDTLRTIALDETISDRTRARADLLLRVAFHDEDAEQRQALRARRVRDEMARAEAIVDDASHSIGWTPPPAVRSHLVNLIRFWKVDADTISAFLYDLSRDSRG
ncbi:helix-turn-helix domain-containing protein [Phyllobacterium leguminum]|uniref:HTH cro/C1-type domain-containing protein n=1 Tax=Phyllobacterium leguminum TaxID=314237 RepID=A0A318T433_9HYPH|nr:helix-turn-helix transcriptional regulator [Phyllobacterium leguminum]PYE86878.1 hypothetical protein C7477_11816 [Phyllobacterium leguminum]